MSGRVRRGASFVGVMLTLVVLWEAYKAMGEATGGVWPGTAIDLPVRTNERSMPHVWDIVGSLFRPARRGGEDTLAVILVRAALWTWRSAAIGFVIGAFTGFGLGVLFVRSKLAERGLMPYVIASQAVPVIAIAPILVVWSGRLELPNWMPISIITAYLAFYPVAINTLRGLRSPEATATELMRSYAASPNQVLWKLRIPAIRRGCPGRSRGRGPRHDRRRLGEGRGRTQRGRRIANRLVGGVVEAAPPVMRGVRRWQTW